MSDVIPAVLSTVPSVADDLGMWLSLNHIGAMKFVDGGFFFFFKGHIYGMWKFPSQGMNLSHSYNLRHGCGKAGSFNPLHEAGD